MPSLYPPSPGFLFRALIYQVSVYDLNMASRVGILSGHTGPVTSVACGDDWILSGSSDCSIRLWQVYIYLFLCLKPFYTEFSI